VPPSLWPIFFPSLQNLFVFRKAVSLARTPFSFWMGTFFFYMWCPFGAFETKLGGRIRTFKCLAAQFSPSPHQLFFAVFPVFLLTLSGGAASTCLFFLNFCSKCPHLGAYRQVVSTLLKQFPPQSRRGCQPSGPTLSVGYQISPNDAVPKRASRAFFPTFLSPPFRWSGFTLFYAGNLSPLFQANSWLKTTSSSRAFRSDG